ncbi:Oidioi.mRNA.OKI2018_I69.chr2.g7765.t1.cds [Oikopleura dioica]|uniref:Oidioi.mRNA.OKI2018_I69.chr2.g7765.t1.cds n=1 Tax=Oikopleura dioica TaxID=34765 RepID=A0ABN7TDS4_OIKDI|nr:Oidioi.mRNA.OKI2018_I69.chr2.g7765.t1.cds [Oikopleura dioica]
MYSTWTRYNAFIELAIGESNVLKEIVKFLAKELPKNTLFRGRVTNPSTNDQILSLEPCNLTKDEDWVWLRLNRPELLQEGAARGSEKLAKTGRKLEISQVESSDVSNILAMIQELAIYEDMLDQCKMTKEWLDEDFSAGPKFGKFDGNLCVATIAKLDGQVVGYTVSIDFFTTSHGKETYLEDLYVKEAFRGQGIGSILLNSVSESSQSRGAAGVYWVCLAWNKKSLCFYEKMGANPLDVTFFRFEPEIQKWMLE